METEATGRVLAEMVVENLGDLWNVSQGALAEDRVRRIVVKDALVDTGATTLALPTRLIHELGLVKSYHKEAITSRGRAKIDIYGPARVTILDRFCTVDVMEVPDEVPALIGQIPLEMLDLIVDSRNRCLMGNPAHNGEHVLELL